MKNIIGERVLGLPGEPPSTRASPGRTFCASSGAASGSPHRTGVGARRSRRPRRGRRVLRSGAAAEAVVRTVHDLRDPVRDRVGNGPDGTDDRRPVLDDSRLLPASPLDVRDDDLPVRSAVDGRRAGALPMRNRLRLVAPAEPGQHRGDRAQHLGSSSAGNGCSGACVSRSRTPSRQASWLCAEVAVQVQGKWVDNGAGLPAGDRSCRRVH